MALGLAALACVPEREPIEPRPQSQASSACAGAEQLASIWAPARRLELDAALEGIPGEWPDQLEAGLDGRMPGVVADWSEAYARACEAEASAVMRCLDAQAWALDASLALIAERPERAASLWTAIERASAGPERCADAKLEAPELAPPRGRELSTLAMLIELGELADAEGWLLAVEREATLADSDAYLWQLEVARARVEHAGGRADVAEQALASAEQIAERLDPRARASVAAARASLAESRGDIEAAKQARERAVSEARDQSDPWLLVDHLRELGRTLIDHGEPGEAIAPLIEAIALSGRAGGPDHPQTARLQTTLAEAQRELGQVEAAYDTLTQARDAFVITLGPDHPQTLATVEAIGMLFVAAGRPGDAQFAFLDLLEVYTDLYGVKDWRTAKIKLELADSLMAMDQHEGAQQLYTEALTPLAQALGPVHPAVVRASIHLGIAELALGNLEAAEPHCARGRDLARALAADDPLVDEAQRCLAEIGARQKQAKKTRKKGS